MVTQPAQPEIQAAVLSGEGGDLGDGAASAELCGTAGMHPAEQRLDQTVEHLRAQSGRDQVGNRRVVGE